MTLEVEWPAARQGLDEFRSLRTRPDKAHVSLKDVEKLRQLIDPQLPDHRSDGRDALVVVLGPPRHAIRLRIGPHATELHQWKWTAGDADAGLPVEDGAAVLQPDRNGRRCHDRPGEHKQKCARQDIQAALQQVLNPASGKSAGKQEPVGPEIVDVNLAGLAFPERLIAFDRNPGETTVD